MIFKFAEINAVKMHYDIQGEGDGLVLIHAGIANLNMWEEQMKAFSGKYRVLRYDVRGWGETPDPEGEYSEHGDLKALMDHLGIKDAHILGISNGGRIAIDFAIAYPNLVKKLILVAPSLGGFTYPEDEFMNDLSAKHEEALEAGNLEMAAEYEAQLWVDGPYRKAEDVDSEFRARALALIRHCLEIPEGKGAGKMLEPYAAERLGEIKSTSMVVIGDKDIEMKAPVTDKLVSEIADVRRVEMKDVAHLPSMEKPEQFNQIVLDFLRE